MNKSSLITAGAGIAFLLTSALPALADYNTSGSGSTSSDDGASGEVILNDVEINKPIHGDDLLKLRASTTLRLEEQRKLKERMQMEHSDASSTENRGDRMEKERMQRASSTEKRIEKAQDKAGDAIEKRIKSLIELKARLANIKLLSADQLASLTVTLDTEIASLTALQGKITAGTATTTLKSDVKSITQDHRVYQLVEPKARIAAAASRIKAVATQLESLATKLQERITAAQTAGVNVTASSAALIDFNAKVADAKVQADAAVTLTANLSPDNGDKTILAANQAALKEARTKLANAEKDLAAARHDAATIYGVVKGKGGVKTATTTP